MVTLATISAVVLFAVLTIIVLLLLTRHAFIGRSERRKHAFREAYRGTVLEFLVEGSGVAERHLANAMTGRERSSIGTLFGEYARMVTGAQQLRIRLFLEENGYVKDEIRQLQRAKRVSRRIMAAQLLGDFGAPSATHALSQAVLTNPSPEIRRAATSALGHIDDHRAVAALLKILATDLLPGGVVAQAMLNIGDRAFGPLIDACTDPQDNVRYYACRLIGLIGSGATSEQSSRGNEALIVVAMTDPEANIRAAACLALGAIGDGAISECVTRSLSDESWRVRGAAALTVGELGMSGNMSNLRHLLDDVSFEVQRAAAYSIVQIDPNFASSHPLIAEGRSDRIEGYGNVFV